MLRGISLPLPKTLAWLLCSLCRGRNQGLLRKVGEYWSQCRGGSDQTLEIIMASSEECTSQMSEKWQRRPQVDAFYDSRLTWSSFYLSGPWRKKFLFPHQGEKHPMLVTDQDKMRARTEVQSKGLGQRSVAAALLNMQRPWAPAPVL